MHTPAALVDLVSLLPHGAIVHDLDGELLAANDAARSLLEGSDLLDRSTAPARNVLPPWHRAAADGTALSELRVDVEEGVGWLTAQSIRTEVAGEQVVVTTLMDHSGRLAMIRELMDDFVLQFDASWGRTSIPVFLAGADGDTLGRLVAANDALGELFDSEAGSLVGRPITELFLPAGNESSAERLVDAVEELADGRTAHHRVHGILRGTAAAGRSVQLELVSSRGPSGRPAFLLGYLIDEEELAETVRAHHLEQRRLERLFSHGSDILAVVSADGRFEFIGPSSVDALGHDRRDLIGSDVMDLVHPSDRALAVEALAATARTPGTSPPLQLRVREGDQAWRHVEVVANNLLDDPEIAGVVVTIRDRSGEARARAQLADRERRYRQIVELSVDGIAVVDHEHRIAFVNERLAEILQREPADLLGRVVIELVAPEDRTFVAEAMQRRREGVQERFPVGMLRSDGSVARVLVSAAPHMVDGEMRGAVAWITDVTESERTRLRLERSEERMRALVEAIPDLIFRMDRRGTYLEHHCSEPQLLLLPPEEFLGRTIFEVIPASISPHTARRFHECILVALDTGEPASIEYELDLVDGAHWFEARFAAAGDDEVLVVVRDITELKESERRRIEHGRELVRRDEELRRTAIEHELERASRVEAMGYLAGTMAHDVNNLLGVINNYAAGIEHSDAPDPVRHDAAEIRAAVRTGAELTGRLLSVGRRTADAPVEVDLVALVRDIGHRLAAAVDPTGQVRLAVDTSHDACAAAVEPARIEQAIMNLILNARDATIEHRGSGEVRLGLALREVDEAGPAGLPAGCYAVIEVSDQGAGVPDEVVPLMWEPFYSTKEERGTGLGLPIVRQVAEQHGGSVVVHRDDPHWGTRVELWLPAACDRDGAASDVEEAPDEPVELLLVDDNARLLDSTARLLEGMGITVRAVRTASDAMAELGRGRPATVLTDVRMPGMSGLELARWIRRRRPDVPVAFMTGYEGDLGPAQELADVATLAKPFSPEDLRRVVDQLREHRLEDQRLRGRPAPR